MKRNQFQNLSCSFVGMLLCVVFSSMIAHSQDKMILTPKGESENYETVVSNHVTGLVLDASVFSYAVVVQSYEGGQISLYPDWIPPDGGIIVTARQVEILGRKTLKVVVSWGFLSAVYMLDYWNASPITYDIATTGRGPDVTEWTKIAPQGGYGESLEEVIGDATYVLSTSFLYVYRDSVTSWKVDTTGLGSASINDISLDTAQYVYAATTNGVYKQHPDSNVWHQITNLPTSNFSNILVDRRDKIFAANYVSYNGKGTYISTDNGSSWTLDSAGIGKQQILKLSDDAYGNTYALNGGGGLGAVLFRRKNNTPGWTRIDGGITAITVNTTTINSVGGDSVLYAATSFGLYSSTDQGTTWIDANAGIPASTFYAFAKGSGGKWFTTTNLGMYSLGPTDTAWTKVFPATGYLGSLQIYTDGIGNIYTANYNSPYLSKSSNNGSTWSPDTAGGAVVPKCIDEKGGQHTVGTLGPRVKPYGGTWGPDTAGFQVTNSSSNYSAAMASDSHGYLYLSGKYFNGSTRVNGQVMRRPIDGGTWVVDTVGLSSYSYLDALYAGKNGETYGTYRPNLVHRSNSGKWSTLNLPSVGVASLTNMVVSVDSSGAVFIALRGSRGSVSYGGLGVFFSTDTGATWKYAGLDSIFVNQLVSYGDSTYAATNNGLYILTRTAVPVTSVQHAANVPMTFALFQNYPNPFNPTTVISYQLAMKSFVTLTVYDILGRKIRTLVNEEQPGGSHFVNWDAASFSSGIYFYRIQAGSFAATKKLLLLK